MEFVDRGKVLSARLSYENAQSLGWLDSRGRFLLNPRLRRMTRDFDSPFLQKDSCIREDLAQARSVEAWYLLGLIDENARPTERGRVFSMFSRGRDWRLRWHLRIPLIQLMNWFMTWQT